MSLSDQERVALNDLRAKADALAEAIDAVAKMGFFVAQMNWNAGKADLTIVRQVPVPMSALNS